MKKLVYIVNAIIVFLIALYEYNSDSDKTIIISSLALAILWVFNLLFGLFAQLDNRPIYRHYYYSALGLFIIAAILLLIWDN